jgi:Cu(I)/Ag(I) efflux system membrane fusion protein
VGNIQTDTIRNGSIGDQLVLTATLNFDQMKSSCKLKSNGQSGKMYFKTGDYVQKGALFTICTAKI